MVRIKEVVKRRRSSVASTSILHQPNEELNKNGAFEEFFDGVKARNFDNEDQLIVHEFPEMCHQGNESQACTYIILKVIDGFLRDETLSIQESHKGLEQKFFQLVFGSMIDGNDVLKDESREEFRQKGYTIPQAKKKIGKDRRLEEFARTKLNELPKDLGDTLDYALRRIPEHNLLNGVTRFGFSLQGCGRAAALLLDLHENMFAVVDSHFHQRNAELETGASVAIVSTDKCKILEKYVFEEIFNELATKTIFDKFKREGTLKKNEEWALDMSLFVDRKIVTGKDKDFFNNDQ